MEPVGEARGPAGEFWGRWKLEAWGDARDAR